GYETHDGVLSIFEELVEMARGPEQRRYSNVNRRSREPSEKSIPLRNPEQHPRQELQLDPNLPMIHYYTPRIQTPIDHIPTKQLFSPTPPLRSVLLRLSGPPQRPWGTLESAAALSVRRVRFTTKWELVNSTMSSSPNQKAQIVEVTLANILPAFTLSQAAAINSKHSISITGNGITTVQPGTVFRLVPRDQAWIDIRCREGVGKCYGDGGGQG
ncbi:hypothetical protein P691DRAFT_786394, partial [Macrolepiota fuliginosa MF-IS2]